MKHILIIEHSGWIRFREIFLFEVTYQLRRIWTWLIFAALLAVSFLMTRDGSLSEALHDDFFVNSPFAVAKTTVFGSLVWLMAAAMVAGDAAARDVTTGMYNLTYSMPLHKAQYLGGRFLAAFIINAMILLAVQAGILLGIYLPGVDAVLLGPFRPAAYLTAYFFIALPNAFVATAIQFSLAAKSGRPMAAYLGSMILFFMSYVVGLFLLFQGRQHLANILDLIGVHFILSELSHLWTPIEKSTRLLALEGTILRNRFLWLGIGMAVLTVTYICFRFVHRAEGNLVDSFLAYLRARAAAFTSTARRFPRQTAPGTTIENSAIQPASSFTRPVVPDHNYGTVSFDFAFSLRQTWAIACGSFKSITKSWGGIALLAVIPLLTTVVIVDQMVINEVPMLPKTGRVLAELTTSLSAEMNRWVIVPLMIIFFAGELVWRERDARMAEIMDTMPGSEWPRFFGKFLGLGLVILLFLVLLGVSGIIAQTMMDYHEFELLLYLKTLLGLQLPEYLIFAILAMSLHVFANQKYIGHLLSIMCYVFITMSPLFGIEHDLLIYGSGPGWTYTEMSGFGDSIGPWLWFKLYWAAWGVIFSILARLLWIRGSELEWRSRVRLARKRINTNLTWTFAIALGLVVTIGGLIFHNTNVLNTYQNSAGIIEHKAEYEKTYGRYAGIPQPVVTASNLEVSIYPQRRLIEISGSYNLVNNRQEQIDSIHLIIMPGGGTKSISFDRPFTAVHYNRSPGAPGHDHGYRIYRLGTPLKPGDSLKLSFAVRIERRGFSVNGVDPSVAENGTYFFTAKFLPVVGYQRDRELTGTAERAAQHLQPRPFIASLYDAEATKGVAQRIDFQATISTDADQVAIAPGVLKKTWTSNGRSYYKYVSDAPIGGSQYIFSARYAVHQSTWKPADMWKPADNGALPDPVDTGTVAIMIYHDPRHNGNVDRIVRSVKASLDYYTAQFGAYPYKQVSFVEHPGDGDGAGIHAVPGMLIMEEGFAFWSPKDEPGSLDLPYAVVAHEMAHQWTVPYANAEGAPVLSESLAWYYAMKAVENSRGKEQLELLRHFMRQPHPHPPIRRGEPLLRGLDPYMSYRRGPFALYALSEYLGDDSLNAGLRRLVEKHRSRNAPLATTLDLFAELKVATPDSLRYLLHDLFEVNTFWELEIEHSNARQSSPGTWQVDLQVNAKKLVFDSAGIESETHMNDWVEIGIYGERVQGVEPDKPVYHQKHRIRSGRQVITVTTNRKPNLAGIDPRYLLIDLQTENNTRGVTVL
ncbi:ABC transporter permease/M1 family aminopeptidase [Flavitalea antarctica]